MTKRTIGFLALPIFLFFCTSLGAAAEEIDKNFHKTFSVKTGDSLALRFGDGNVTITPWDKDILDVTVRYWADVDLVGVRLGGRDTFDVEFRQSGDTVYVIGKEPSGAALGFYNERVHEYFYEIHSPRTLRLDLEGDDGDLSIENWAAEIEIQIDDGDIRLKDIAGGRTVVRGEDSDVKIEKLSGDLEVNLDDGDLTLVACDFRSCRVESEDGDVTVRQCGGAFDITTDDGNVVLEKAEAQGLNISTADGDIQVDLLAGPKLDGELKTDDGDIQVDFEKGLPVSFEATADDSDSIHVDLKDMENYREDERSKSGSINGGMGRLKILTADGDVTIREK
jgi:DUF4097 and DUF4098 domain-containing protein YvlB